MLVAIYACDYAVLMIPLRRFGYSWYKTEVLSRKSIVIPIEFSIFIFVSTQRFISQHTVSKLTFRQFLGFGGTQLLHGNSMLRHADLMTMMGCKPPPLTYILRGTIRTAWDCTNHLQVLSLLRRWIGHLLPSTQCCAGKERQMGSMTNEAGGDVKCYMIREVAIATDSFREEIGRG